MPKDTSSKPRGVGPSAGGPEALVHPPQSARRVSRPPTRLYSEYVPSSYMPSLGAVSANLRVKLEPEEGMVSAALSAPPAGKLESTSAGDTKGLTVSQVAQSPSVSAPPQNSGAKATSSAPSRPTRESGIKRELEESTRAGPGLDRALQANKPAPSQNETVVADPTEPAGREPAEQLSSPHASLPQQTPVADAQRLPGEGVVAMERHRMAHAIGTIDDLTIRIKAMERTEQRLRKNLGEMKERFKNAKADGEGLLNLLVLAEEKVSTAEAVTSMLKDDVNRYRGWWITEYYSLRAVLGMLPQDQRDEARLIEEAAEDRYTTWSNARA
ncbi:hypothetical protein FA13DRAFT_1715750 [Coprinellus micaceus]|uniref:Uncharacterized protein n=1 Tax=Coprinellus micaceus TaxID=71717 RepID=A0A4Y7SM17_COPMI|nr:hypothetical protein FA13DRAFT_1715750 [Coprinellus micaceus]